MKTRALICSALLFLSVGALGASAGPRSTVALAARPVAASPYARFVGRWFHHGGSLTVTRNGHGMYTFRTYVFCHGGRLTACDKVIKNTILAGGFTRFTLHRSVVSTAFGTVTDSVYSWQVGTRVRLSAKSDDTLVLRALGMPAIVLCGPRASAAVCGA